MRELEFEGTAYAREFEGQRAVQIQLESDSIVARTSAGLTLSIPYSDCQIERGGANGNTWFCHTSDRSVTLMSAAPGFAEALSGAAGTLAPEIDRLQQRAQRGQRRRFAIGIGVVAAVLAVLILGSIAVQSAGQVAVDALPTSVDKRMGDLAYANMSMQGGVLHDPEIDKALATIVDRVGRGGSGAFEYRVHVHDAPITNAFALPGGVLVVYTGLLRAAETPEQVAGVLAHEISHVQRRHGMRRIAQSLGVVAALQLLVGDVSGLAAVAVHVLRESTVNSYSRQQEREADLDAVQMLTNAGIDPRALADFFQVLKREERGPQIPEWLATHPDLDARIADIRAQAERARPRKPNALDVNWPEVQKRVKASEGGTAKPGDKPAPSGARPFVAVRPGL